MLIACGAPRKPAAADLLTFSADRGHAEFNGASVPLAITSA
jgi:hypothetical protein